MAGNSVLFQKFKELSVIQRLLEEMDRALDIRDKVLAEFILDLAKSSTSVMKFEQKLADSGADFSSELVSTMFALITKMLPECFERTYNKTHTQIDNDPILSAEIQQLDAEE
jgi:hypothetical protein